MQYQWQLPEPNGVNSLAPLAAVLVAEIAVLFRFKSKTRKPQNNFWELNLPANRRCLESWLMRNWLRRGMLAYLLWPLSAIFFLLAGTRRSLYRKGFFKPARLPVPVIVVGNIFIGGTGKTPLTIALVRQLRQAGYTPAVVSRGYGSKSSGVRQVGRHADPAQVGDEPVLIANAAQCPVIVGRDRVAAARILLADHPEVDLIVLDDGLQHYALARDVEVAVFDERGFGNGWMLPAGPLREPRSRKTDFTLVNAEHIPDGMPAGAMRMQLIGDTAERLANRKESKTLAMIRQEQQTTGMRIVAAAGLGNPARFFGMLQAAGLIIREMPLPDHFDFLENPFKDVDADAIMITEKDAVKCERIDALRNDTRLWVIPVSAKIDDALTEHILEKLCGYPIARYSGLSNLQRPA